MKKYDTIIFEVDGVLLDTLPDLEHGINYILGENHLPQRSIEEIRSFVGDGMRKLVRRSAPQGQDKVTIERLYRQFIKYYTYNCQIMTVRYPGTEEMVHELKKCGYKLAVVTNKNAEAVSRMLPYYFDDKIDVAYAEEKGAKRKPAPDGIEYVLEHLQSSKSRCLLVGGSTADVKAAQNAGVDGIYATWGYQARERLEEAGAAEFIESPEQLLQKMQKK